MPSPRRGRPPPASPKACSARRSDRLFAVAEAYPELRATENFQQLQAELVDTEDQIAAARRIYNGNVQIYNTRIQVFPNVLIASVAHFEPRVFFEIDDATEREPEQVDFAAPLASAGVGKSAPSRVTLS